MVATAPISIDSRRDELQAAFLAFGSVSQQLTGAFESLSGEVARLRRELKVAHAAKDSLAARLAALVTGLPGGVLVLDADGIIQECNPAALELLGEPLLGLSFNAVITRAAQGPGSTVEHTQLRSGRYVNISRRALGTGGAPGNSGALGGGDVVLLADVTESHLMQVLLTRQQRLLTLGELAAGLAHQIRTPLATALLYASQMALPNRSAEAMTRCGEKTVGSLRQLEQLVTDMLAFTHGSAAREVVSVSALLEQVAQWLRPLMRGNVRLTIRTQAPHLKVRVNAPSLVSVVLNLATNALQAASGDLDLELLARLSPQGRAEIVVSDNGPGIPEALRERIFEPFFTTRASGNGIGLAVVKSVVEGHGGSVRLADAARGAHFVIDLPAEDSE